MLPVCRFSMLQPVAVAVSLEGRTRTGLFFFFFFLFPAIYAVPALPLEVGSELIRLVSIAPRPLSQHATAAAASFKTPATHSAHGSPREVSAFVLRYYYLFFFFLTLPVVVHTSALSNPPPQNRMFTIDMDFDSRELVFMDC